MVFFEKNASAFNLALDESIFHHVSKALSPPTIRFYSNSDSFVSIPLEDAVKLSVDASFCNKNRFKILRRISGGVPMLHESSKELCYLVCSHARYTRNPSLAVSKWLVSSLSELGLYSSSNAFNEVFVKGRRISQGTGFRVDNAFFHHGSVFHEVDESNFFSALAHFRFSSSEDSFSRLTCILDHTLVPQKDLLIALERGFTGDKNFFFSAPSESELSLARELVKKKYSLRSWNYSR